MIKLLARMDEFCSTKPEIPQAHIDAIHKAIEKKVSNWFYVLDVLSLEFFHTTKLSLDCKNEYVVLPSNWH